MHVLQAAEMWVSAYGTNSMLHSVLCLTITGMSRSSGLIEVHFWDKAIDSN